MEKLILVSALAAEAAPSREMLDRLGIDHQYIEIGIGPINAAKSAALLRTEVEGHEVIYLGSAGTFAKLTIPYLATVSRVHWMPCAERIGLAKAMPNLFPPIDIESSMQFDLPAKEVLCSTSVSFSDEIRITLPNRDDLIENMELYAVAKELQAASRLHFIIGITNSLGQQASQDWEKNFTTVATMSAELLEEYLCP